MTLQQIRYFIAVAECGSISAAAKKLFISQSSISEAIKEIESTYGITAFNRHSRGIQLTRDGDELLVELMRIQHHLEYLDERYSMRQKRQDVLSVATQHHICGLDSFAAFLSESQEDTYWMEFLECSTPKVLSEVENNAADIGIVFFNAEAEKQMLRELKSRHLEFHLICGGQAMLILVKTTR